MAVVITDQIYIGFQERIEGSWKLPLNQRNKTLLGFATYLEDNKAFENRKRTIDYWSQPYIQYYIDDSDPRWDPTRQQNVQQVRDNRPDLVPKVMDNPLQLGFKISKEVRRSGWGSGNVLWRIEDPRGFELEISSANMASIMDYCIIDHGEIMTACRWGWDKTGGSRVVLLPEGSEPYLEALEDTKRINKSLSWRDVCIGDEVELKNGFVGTYLGAFYYTQVSSNSSNSDAEFYYYLDQSKRKAHFFKQTNGEAITMVISPKASSIVSCAKHETSAESTVEIINSYLKSYNVISGRTSIIFVSLVPTDLKEVSFQLVPVEYSEVEEVITTDHTYGSSRDIERKSLILRMSEGLFSMYLSPSYGKSKMLRLNRIDEKTLADNQYRYVCSRVNSWSSYVSAETTEVDIDIVKTKEINRLMIKVEDQLFPFSI